MSRRAGIYLRISKAPDGSTLGVERQLPPCEKLCADRGWTVVDTYIDNDVSAYRRKKRPQYERLLKDADAGYIDAIVAWHPDRLSRDPDIDNIRIIDLHDHHGTQLATVLAGDHDLSTPAGRMMFRQLGILARYESEHRSERNKLKHEELARNGRPGTGERPYGFEGHVKDEHGTVTNRDRAFIAHVPEEAERIRQAAQDLLAGKTLSQIVNDWNAANIPASGGGQWSYKTLKRMLLSPRIIGQREHRGKLYPAAWKPILDPEVQAALKLLPPMNHKAPTQPVRRYVLTGLLYCSHCGSKMDGQTRMNGKRSYECRHCFKLTRLADPLEQEVKRQALDVLDSPEVIRSIIRAKDTDRNMELATEQLQRDQDALDSLKASGVLTDKEHRKKTRQLQARAEAIAAKLPVPAVGLLGLPLGETVLGWWMRNKDLDKRRDLLHLAIDKIVLLPTVRGRRGFDPDAELDIQWQEYIDPDLVAALVRKADS
jgi:site-specific DNA recombinase